jgi:C4-dicarboxylate-binding protein DctP
MWPSLVEERHYEVIKYYTALDWMWDANQVIINKDIWAKLPADLKAAVEKAAAEAEIHQYDVQKKAIKQFIEFLSKQPNFQIYYPTPEEKAAFRAKADSLAIWEEICTPWLEKHYPGQNMTKKILDGLTAIHEKVLAEKAAKK